MVISSSLGVVSEQESQGETKEEEAGFGKYYEVHRQTTSILAKKYSIQQQHNWYRVYCKGKTVTKIMTLYEYILIFP